MSATVIKFDNTQSTENRWTDAAIERLAKLYAAHSFETLEEALAASVAKYREWEHDLPTDRARVLRERVLEIVRLRESIHALNTYPDVPLPPCAAIDLAAPENPQPGERITGERIFVGLPPTETATSRLVRLPDLLKIAAVFAAGFITLFSFCWFFYNFDAIVDFVLEVAR